MDADTFRPPARDVEQQAVQRAADQRGVHLVRQRAGVGVVVVAAAYTRSRSSCPSSVLIRPSLAPATDSAGGTATGYGRQLASVMA